METIKELRTLLQEEKVNPSGWRRPWGYKTFQRGPSIYITRALLETRITPTQVTVVGIFLGLLGAWNVLNPNWHYELFGLFLIYLNILSDKVDGELARYRKNYSLKGIYWDEINHLVVPPLFWIALAWGISSLSIFGDRRFLIMTASLGAIALMINRVVHSLAPQIFAKKYIKQSDKLTLPIKITDIVAEPRRTVLRTIARFIHSFQDLFIVISATAGIIIIEATTRRDAIFHPLLSYFMLAGSLLFVFFAIENTIRNARRVESDISRITSSYPRADQ